VLELSGVKHIQMPAESEKSVSKEHYASSELYKAIVHIAPDLLIVDRMWMVVRNMLPALSCKKLFVTSQVIDDFFRIETPKGENISFDGSLYERCIGMEPFESTVELEHIEPVIIRNKDEILPREEARRRLLENAEREGLYDVHGLPKTSTGRGLFRRNKQETEEKPICFLGMNFLPGYYEKLAQKYSYLEDEYIVISSTNMDHGGLFPVADYYNAIDFMVCSATYNLFWESRVFGKEAVFEVVPARFCNQQARLDMYSEYVPKENGADQLARIIVDIL